MRLNLPSRTVAGIARVGVAVVRPRQLLLRHRAHDIGRDDHHQFGLLVDVVAALEQRRRAPAAASGPGMPLICCLVCSWIMPAIASEPPEGISTVVSARRVLIDGMVSGRGGAVAPIDCASVSSLSSRARTLRSCTLRLMRPSDSTTGREVEADAELLELDLRLADRWRLGGVAGVAGRDREIRRRPGRWRSRRRSPSGSVRPACGRRRRAPSRAASR